MWVICEHVKRGKRSLTRLVFYNFFGKRVNTFQRVPLTRLRQLHTCQGSSGLCNTSVSAFATPSSSSSCRSSPSLAYMRPSLCKHSSEIVLLPHTDTHGQAERCYIAYICRIHVRPLRNVSECGRATMNMWMGGSGTADPVLALHPLQFLQHIRFLLIWVSAV